MHIEKTRLVDFRNYEDETIDFHEKVNIVTGLNGQGKTNLIESIYILSMGRSFRTALDGELKRFGKEGFSVCGHFIKDGAPLSVKVSLSGRDKSFFVDGIRRKKNADLLQHVYAVVFSPDDLRIVSDDPEKRRRFMDRELFQIRPLYYKKLVQYRRAMKNRNHLLKQADVDEDLMAVYEWQMADNGAVIMKERKFLSEKLDQISSAISENITKGSDYLKIAYDPNQSWVGDEQELRERLLKKQKENRKKDRLLGSTSEGPHKDDLKIVSKSVDLRHYGSRGQQRTAALSLKLAELDIIREETGEDAILLMDDVLSELDGERQKRLIERFSENQLFITVADMNPELEGNLPKGRTIVVENGKLNILSG